jgi:hypothetical protein
MNTRAALACATALLAGTVQAADPTASFVTSGFTFTEFTGTTVLGEGNLDDSSVLYWVDEKTGPNGKSWYLVFDPMGLQSVVATVSFDSPISGVFFTQPELDGSNAVYGADGINYGTHPQIGLENNSSLTIVGNQITLRWTANDPGDHIRVFTQAVPEPSTYALMAGGLLAVAWLARRRRTR